jgi:DNA-binding LacI/PurR family transcriptional regulator
MAVTLEDVAKKAGVSHTTVSLVLKGDNKISKRTREKVLQAVSEMNYYPNYHARSLANGKTGTIAVVATFFSSFFAADIMKGIEDESLRTDYNISQYSTKGDRNRQEALLKNILYGRMADAVIVVSIEPERAILDEYMRKGVPVIFIERAVEGFCAAKVDNEKGASLAAEYIIKSGRKNIAMLYGKYEDGDCSNSRERLTGFRRTLDRAGIGLPDGNIIRSAYEMSDGAGALDEILKIDRKIDAVFCATGDMTAIGLMKQAASLGIKVPQDIAVIGYDDILVSSIVNPALTTVRQPIIKLGREAFNMARSMAHEPDGEPAVTVFEPELIIRESA